MADVDVITGDAFALGGYYDPVLVLQHERAGFDARCLDADEAIQAAYDAGASEERIAELRTIYDRELEREHALWERVRETVATSLEGVLVQLQLMRDLFAEPSDKNAFDTLETGIRGIAR